MLDLSDQQFENLVSQAIDNIPQKYYKHIDNLAFVVEAEPSAQQRNELKLHCHQTLFGLYQGVPLNRRSANYSLVIPDKITIFKKPILVLANDIESARKIVNNTVWHEVAHYFGLDHQRIHQLENQ